VGVSFLIFGHVQTVEWFSASLFMLFSFSKLIQSSLNFGKERNIALGRFSMDTPRLRRKLALDETETVVLQLQASPNEEIITGTPHWPAVSLFLQGRPRLCAVYERILPAISMEGYSVETVFVINAVFRALSGLSQGTTGSGGPPVIAAYAWFNPTKGAIRGLSGLSFVTCGSLMCDHAMPSAAAVTPQCHIFCAVTTFIARTARTCGARGDIFRGHILTHIHRRIFAPALTSAFSAARSSCMQVCAWLLFWDLLWALGYADLLLKRYTLCPLHSSPQTVFQC
jgi:hypothetical protein